MLSLRSLCMLALGLTIIAAPDAAEAKGKRKRAKPPEPVPAATAQDGGEIDAAPPRRPAAQPPAGAAAQGSPTAGEPNLVLASATHVAPPIPDGGHVVEHEQSEHEQFIGHIGVTYFGLNQVPLGTIVKDAFKPSLIDTPVIGVTYWFSERLGIDVGVGFGVASDSMGHSTARSGELDEGLSTYAFLVHAGLPVALAHGKHYTFEVSPDFSYGYANVLSAPVVEGVPDAGRSGYKFDMGVRAGAEIHLGFVHLPEVAIQVGIGIFFRVEGVYAEHKGTLYYETLQSFTTSLSGGGATAFFNNLAIVYYL